MEPIKSLNEKIIKDFAARCRSLSFWTEQGRFPPSLYYNFLRVLVQTTQAKLAVELGVCGGGGSYNMAKASNHCKVVGVDIAREYADNIDFIQDTCSNFTFVLGDSIAVSSDIYNEYGSIDVLFIDTDHTYEQTKGEFETYLPLMTPSEKSVICMDDLNREGTREYWNEIDFPKVEIPVLHIGGGPTDGSFGVVWGL